MALRWNHTTYQEEHDMNRISTGTKADKYECVPVKDADGQLEGFALVGTTPWMRRDSAWVRVGDAGILSPVRCCATCAWTDLDTAASA